MRVIYAMSQQEDDHSIRRDLERRIETLENLDDDEFGTFGRIDYLILIVGAILLPALAMILAR